MADSEKKYALITGASKGIGKAIAIALAKRAFNLLIVARSENELSLLRTEIINKYGVRVEMLAIDLGETDAPTEVADWISTKGYQLNALINNAGYGIWGNFADQKLSEQMNMCRLNMDVVTEFCHLLLPNLLKAEQAYILNVSSTAAYQAVPTLAIYSATKAYILSLTRALRFELKDTSISVSCLCPGPVDTGFAERAGLDPFSKMAQKFNMQPDEVAEIAIKGLLKKKSEIIPGLTNLISVIGVRFLPKALIEKMAAGIYKT
ncbi:SDR family oxidoreductase [Pedobacter sp. CCM 8938]|uniref:SDR family oxidoreductase n=2 Tax=Pedobacter fastidiosus TaxID=2765361 RepID=A0ABR7KTN2_9SPHI|nr:SDR family oxidoreductase [Pedobacter fastidiosus]